MKKLITMLFLLALSVSFNNKAFSQANSVGLNGSFIYSSISGAYAAIGVVGSPQLIELSAAYTGASETFPITLGVKAGVSASNTITIRPSAGANGLLITSAVTNNYLFFLTGAYIIVDGRPGGVTSSPSNYLSITNSYNTTANGNAGTVVFNGADNCILQYVNATAAAGTLTFTGARCINIAGATANPSNNNIVQNCIVRGGLRGIQNFGLDAATINHNCIIRNNDIAQYFNIGSLISNDSNTLIQNNKYHFTSAITTIATFLVGIQVQGSYTKIENNELYDFTSLNAASYLHMSDFGINNTFTRNKIHSNVSNPTTTNVVVGVQFSGSGTTLFKENEVYDLKQGAAGTIIGLNIASNGSATGTLNIIKNKIYDLSSTVGAFIEGMQVTPRSGNTVNITENSVSIANPNNAATGVFGIYSSFITAASETYTANINNNSVYVGGVNLGTVGVFINSVGIYRDNNFPGSVYNQYRNNVINERTTGDLNYQFHLAFWLDTLTGTYSLDSNNYYASDPNGGYTVLWDDSSFTNSDLVQYKAYASPNEANSTFGNSNFLSLTMNFEACPMKSPVTVQLRNSTTPYAVVESVSGAAGGNFANVIPFSNAVDGTPYYIVVKSVNMVETWSATTVTFSNNGASYDFTTSISQAYGNNQRMSGGIPSVYQGDVNQDGFVNLTDINGVNNVSSIFSTSPATDFNCDGTTDLSDLTLASNNSSNFIQRQAPPGALAPSVKNTTTNDNVVNSQRIMRLNAKPETSDINKVNMNSIMLEN